MTGDIYGATGGPMASLSIYFGMTYKNQGVSATCTAYGVTTLPTYLTSYTPLKVYSNYGMNDIGILGGGTCGNVYASIDQWLADYGTFLTNTTNAGAVLYPMQIIPCCNYCNGRNISQTIKLWNAALEDFAYQNNLNMSATYLEMSDPNNDCLYYIANGDVCGGTHPNFTGDAVMGYLMYKSAIPTRSRDWGDSSYPAFGHESWSWWIITGAGSISGGTIDSVTKHTNGGNLYLSNGANAVSDVFCIVSGNKSVSITASVSEGKADIYYRTSATTNFTRSASSPSWTSYKGIFTTTDQFIQIKIANSNATELHVNKLTLNWNVTHATVKPSGVTVKTSGASYK